MSLTRSWLKRPFTKTVLSRQAAAGGPAMPRLFLSLWPLVSRAWHLLARNRSLAPTHFVSRAVILTTVVAMSPHVAFGQSAADALAESGAEARGEANIYYRPQAGQSVDALTLQREVRKELEQSRQLNLVDMASNSAMEIDGPLRIVASAAGDRMAASFEVTLPRGDPQSVTVTCRAGSLGDCAEAVVARAEHIARTQLRQR